MQGEHGKGGPGSTAKVVHGATDIEQTLVTMKEQVADYQAIFDPIMSEQEMLSANEPFPKNKEIEAALAVVSDTGRVPFAQQHTRAGDRHLLGSLLPQGNTATKPEKGAPIDHLPANPQSEGEQALLVMGCEVIMPADSGHETVSSKKPFCIIERYVEHVFNIQIEKKWMMLNTGGNGCLDWEPGGEQRPFVADCDGTKGQHWEVCYPQVAVSFS